MNSKDIEVEVFVLCREIELAEGSLRVDGVRGFFRVITPKAMPWICSDQAYVFAQVSRITSETALVIRIGQADAVKPDWEMPKIFPPSHQTDSFQMLGDLRGMELSIPGEYWVQLIVKDLANGAETVLETRRLHLLRPLSRHG